MAKAAASRKVNISVNGVLDIDKSKGVLSVENGDTGEIFDLSDLLLEFNGQPVKMSVSYDEDLA